MLTLNIHHSRVSDPIRPDCMLTEPPVPILTYRDGFGNWCSRLVAPTGMLRISTDALINDSGAPDTVAPWAEQLPTEALPEETLVYLLGSRYCETDRLSETAWQLFNDAPTGWGHT